MDQSKTNLPHLIRERKAGSNLWRLRFVLLCLCIQYIVWMLQYIETVTNLHLISPLEHMSQQQLFMVTEPMHTLMFTLGPMTQT